jgi:cobalt-zinc-cadmium efflux system outer membrane protein
MPSGAAVRRSKSRVAHALVAALAAVGLLTPVLLAQPADSPLTLRDALDLALARNRGLAAALRQRSIGEARVRAAGQLPNPDISFEASKDTPHQSVMLGVPIEIGGQRSRRVALARQEAALGEADVAAATRVLRRAVREDFFGLLAADEGARLAQDVVEIARRVRDVAQARFDEGAAPRVELLAAELAVGRAEVGLDLALAERAVSQAMLNELLDRPPAHAVTLAGDLTDAAVTPALEAAVAMALAANPDLLAVERSITLEERRVDLLRAERVPTPVVQFGGVFNAPGEFNAGTQGGVSIGLPIFNRNQGEIAASQATAGQLQLRRDALQRMIENEVFAAEARVQEGRQRAATYRERLVPAAVTLQELAEESYRLGRSSLLAVLEAQRSLRDVRREYLEALLALQQAIASLEETIGAPLP